MKQISMLLALLALLSACAKAPPVTPDSFYRLPEATPLNGTLPAPLSDGIVLVRPLLSDGLHSERSLLYSDDPAALTLRQHHYHFWIDSPQRLLQRQLIALLRAANAAPMVVGESNVAADLIISGRIARFEYSRDAGHDTAHLDLELRIDTASSESPILLHEYMADVPAGDAGMPALVRAFDSGLQQIFTAFLSDAHTRLARP